MRKWSDERVQWGRPIGKHEAIAHKIAEHRQRPPTRWKPMDQLANELAEREGYDIRLEAAAAKEWATVAGVAASSTRRCRSAAAAATRPSARSRSRGEAPIGVERMLRDCRINLIFEGSSEIMHLFIAREAVDKHLQVAGALDRSEASIVEEARGAAEDRRVLRAVVPDALAAAGACGRSTASFGELAAHLRFCERTARKLARAVFHGMVVHGPKLERKQAFLFRLVDICNELFAMTAAILQRAAHGAQHRTWRTPARSRSPTRSAASSRARIGASFGAPVAQRRQGASTRSRRPRSPASTLDRAHAPRARAARRAGAGRTGRAEHATRKPGQAA